MGERALSGARQELQHWRALLSAGEIQKVITGVRDLLGHNTPLVIKVEAETLLAVAYAKASEIGQAMELIGETQRLISNTHQPQLVHMVQDAIRQIRLAAMRAIPGDSKRPSSRRGEVTAKPATLAPLRRSIKTAGLPLETRAGIQLEAILKHTGDQVRDIRTGRGLTQRGLSSRLGTPPSQISHLENGSTMPSLSFLVRVATQLGAQITITLNAAPSDEPSEALLTAAPLMKR